MGCDCGCRRGGEGRRGGREERESKRVRDRSWIMDAKLSLGEWRVIKMLKQED